MNLKEFIETNGYYLKDKIDYEWDRYGNNTPSITSILKLIGDPGFDYVMKIHSSAVDKAAKKGSQVHADIEGFFDGNNKEINKNAMKFHSLYNVKILAQEKRYEKDGVSGTVDLIANIDYPGIKGIYNIDYKNSNKHSAKYLLQLGGYERLTGYPGMLVYLKGRIKIKEVPNQYKNIFIELKDYFFKLLNK